jgi:hypothetical protein
MVKPPCTLPTANDKTAGGRFLKISIGNGAAAFLKFPLGKGRPLIEVPISKGPAAF